MSFYVKLVVCMMLIFPPWEECEKESPTSAEGKVWARTSEFMRKSGGKHRQYACGGPGSYRLQSKHAKAAVQGGKEKLQGKAARQTQAVRVC